MATPLRKRKLWSRGVPVNVKVYVTRVASSVFQALEKADVFAF